MATKLSIVWWQSHPLNVLFSSQPDSKVDLLQAHVQLMGGGHNDDDDGKVCIRVQTLAYTIVIGNLTWNKSHLVRSFDSIQVYFFQGSLCVTTSFTSHSIRGSFETSLVSAEDI